MRSFPFKGSSLRIKLLIMFIVLTSIPLIIVGLVSFQKSYHTLSDHSKASTMLLADQLVRDIDILFQDAFKLLELGSNPTVLNFLSSQLETYEEAKEIVLTLEAYRKTYQYDSVLNIQMVNLYGKGISERRGVFLLEQNPMRSTHLNYLINHPDGLLILPPTDKDNSDNRFDGFSYDNHSTVTIIAPIKQRVTHEIIGFIVIDLNKDAIMQVSQNLTIGDSGYFLLFDQYNKPIPLTHSQSDSYLSGQVMQHIHTSRGSLTQSIENKTYFIVHATSQMTNWTVVGIAPLREIISEANEIRNLIIVSVLLSGLFVILLYVSLTKRIIRPIQLLKIKMRKAADGYLEAKIKTDGHDEIADLSDSFNTMLDNIKLLIDKNNREQEQVKKAELRTLQAQINPHFLYNTLESIIWLAQSNQNEKVVQLVKAMAKFFRISLNKGKDWVSIKTELDHVQSYLTIQHMRYYDILSYEIDVPKELYPYPILGMTLQPLIENAIYHGIKNKRGMGIIRVTGEMQSDAIVLIVTDNGAGMSADKLQRVNASLLMSADNLGYNGDNEFEGGFGLFNVHQRIRLYFGEQYGLHLESVEGEGTKVCIKIPSR